MRPNDKQNLEYKALIEERFQRMKYQTQLQLLNIVVIGSIVSFSVSNCSFIQVILIIPIISFAIFLYHLGHQLSIKRIEHCLNYSTKSYNYKNIPSYITKY